MRLRANDDSIIVMRSVVVASDDGRLNGDQGQLFYSFRLEEMVPAEHLVRGIAGALDLSWVHGELAPYYSRLGRLSIDPVLMTRMLIVG